MDNAATSFPKPEQVYQAVNRAMREAGGNPGRSGHRLSLAASRIVAEARLRCAKLLGAQAPELLVFTPNATTALNIALKGLLTAGDHVLTSSLEHNSVTRPLYYLQQAGVEVTKLPTDLNTGLSVDALERALRPNTKMLVCSHVSNVTGTVNDLAALGAFCRAQGLIFLVDAAQSAGVRRLDVREMQIDLLAFPGHKGLLGLQGTGGLYLRPGLEFAPLLQGGTGSRSELLAQPERLPEKFESGTLNTPGLAGLAAGVEFVLERGVAAIESREKALVTRLLEGVHGIKGIQYNGPAQGYDRGGVVSLRFAHVSPDAAALFLDSAFNLAVRSGLHCAADAHRTIGALESGGTLRISPNYFNTEAEIDRCLTALSHCAKGL